MRLAWGKSTYIGIYPDTVALTNTLRPLAPAGFAQAKAAPITG